MATSPLSIRLTLAVLATIFFAAAYGALSAIIPVLAIKVVFLVFFAMIGLVTFQAIPVPLAMALPVALLTGLTAALIMWVGWFWVQDGRAVAGGFLTSGPGGWLKWISAAQHSGDFSLTRRGTTTQIGPVMLGVLWAGQTALFALAPVAGVVAARWWPADESRAN